MSTNQALVAARDSNEGVRNIAGILITTVATDTVKAGGSLGTAWPELFPALVEMLGSGQLQVGVWAPLAGGLVVGVESSSCRVS